MFRLGQISVARDHMEQVLTIQRSDPSSYDFLLGYGRDPAVHAMATLGWILWYQACRTWRARALTKPWQWPGSVPMHSASRCA